MMKQWSKWLIASMGLTCAATAFANPFLRMVSVNPLTPCHPIFTIGAGASSSTSSSGAASYPIINPVIDQFYNYSGTNNSRNPSVLVGFMGEEFVHIITHK